MFLASCRLELRRLLHNLLGTALAVLVLTGLLFVVPLLGALGLQVFLLVFVGWLLGWRQAGGLSRDEAQGLLVQAQYLIARPIGRAQLLGARLVVNVAVGLATCTLSCVLPSLTSLYSSRSDLDIPALVRVESVHKLRASGYRVETPQSFIDAMKGTDLETFRRDGGVDFVNIPPHIRKMLFVALVLGYTYGLLSFTCELSGSARGYRRLTRPAFWCRYAPVMAMPLALAAWVGPAFVPATRGIPSISPFGAAEALLVQLYLTPWMIAGGTLVLFGAYVAVAVHDWQTSDLIA
jgi:hypothetical protein